MAGKCKRTFYYSPDLHTCVCVDEDDELLIIEDEELIIFEDEDIIFDMSPDMRDPEYIRNQ